MVQGSRFVSFKVIDQAEVIPEEEGKKMIAVSRRYTSLSEQSIKLIRLSFFVDDLLDDTLKFSCYFGIGFWDY